MLTITRSALVACAGARGGVPRARATSRARRASAARSIAWRRLELAAPHAALFAAGDADRYPAFVDGLDRDDGAALQDGARRRRRIAAGVDGRGDGGDAARAEPLGGGWRGRPIRRAGDDESDGPHGRLRAMRERGMRHDQLTPTAVQAWLHGAERRARVAVELRRGAQRRLPRLRERRRGRQERGEPAVEDALDLLAVGGARRPARRARRAVGAAFDGEVERVVRDARVDVDAAVVLRARCSAARSDPDTPNERGFDIDRIARRRRRCHVSRPRRGCSRRCERCAPRPPGRTRRRRP